MPGALLPRGLGGYTLEDGIKESHSAFGLVAQPAMSSPTSIRDSPCRHACRRSHNPNHRAPSNPSLHKPHGVVCSTSPTRTKTATSDLRSYSICTSASFSPFVERIKFVTRVRTDYSNSLRDQRRSIRSKPGRQAQEWPGRGHGVRASLVLFGPRRALLLRVLPKADHRDAVPQ